RAEDIAVVDREGAQVEGSLAPTSELGLHLLLYERNDAGAVVHTHAPYATALSCVVDEVPAVHYLMLMLCGSMKVAGYATFGAAGGTAITMAKLGARTVTVGALGSDDLGDLVVTLLGRLGVETDHLARKDGVQTSATVLPIRPNGDRPALHVIGANASFTRED